MKDIVGEHNPLTHIVEKTATSLPDPSIYQIKNMVSEYIGIPLGD